MDICSCYEEAQRPELDFLQLPEGNCGGTAQVEVSEVGAGVRAIPEEWFYSG